MGASPNDTSADDSSPSRSSSDGYAVFHCVNCGHEDNADHNAALNILDRAFQPQPSTGRGTARRGSGTSVSPEGTSRGRAVSAKRETTH
ncbi:zinc ribbon domain-containing protein [Bifidobacterium breve]|uniref:zinc ribbon domain-containing protein n=1 Tax=Bifidobacterium breve TaxID=1685 RepID=UPI003D7F78D4